jgi:hypothetical protein
MSDNEVSDGPAIVALIFSFLIFVDATFIGLPLIVYSFYSPANIIQVPLHICGLLLLFFSITCKNAVDKSGMQIFGVMLLLITVIITIIFTNFKAALITAIPFFIISFHIFLSQNKLENKTIIYPILFFLLIVVSYFLIGKSYDGYESYKNNVPINFYGRLVNQDGVGISGIKLKAHITDSDFKVSGNIFINTDKNGYFSIENRKGIKLWISPNINIPGYITPKRTNNSYFYGNYYSENERHSPDPNSPVILTLWEKRGGMELNQLMRPYRFNINRNYQEKVIYTVNLKSHQQYSGYNENGDIVVELFNKEILNETVKKTSTSYRRYYWSVKITMLDQGGFFESKEPFMFLAPESGYQEFIKLDSEKITAYSKDEKSLNYYFKDKDNNYGSFNLSVDISGGLSSVEIDQIIINPIGVRYLEPKKYTITE